MDVMRQFIHTDIRPDKLLTIMRLSGKLVRSISEAVVRYTPRHSRPRQSTTGPDERGDGVHSEDLNGLASGNCARQKKRGLQTKHAGEEHLERNDTSLSDR